MTHHLKILAPFADAVMRGDKTFEVRKNDRGFQKGDEIVFEAVNELGESYMHSINDARFVITYVLAGWGISEGYVVFGISLLEEENEDDETPFIPLDDKLRHFTFKLVNEEGEK